MTDTNATITDRIELADARMALDYATKINDRFGMVVAMRRIRKAKATRATGGRQDNPPAAA